MGIEPVHGGGCWPLPVPQVWPLTVPDVCFQSIRIGCWPLVSAIVRWLLPFAVQVVPALLGLRVSVWLGVIPTSTAVTEASCLATANATCAVTWMLQSLVATAKNWSGAHVRLLSVTPPVVMTGGWPELGVEFP